MDEALLDSIYDTVLRPEAWDDVLGRLADGLGAEGGALVWQDLFTNAAKGIFARTDPEAVTLFSGYFATRNPLRPKAAEVRRTLDAWRPRLVRDEDRMPKAEFLMTEFYNDFFRRFGFHSSLAIGVEVDGRNGGTLDLLKSRGAGEFSDSDLAFAARVQPHLRRAFRAARETASTRGGLSAGEGSVFDAWRRGAMVASADRRVHYLNPAAEAIARVGAAIRVVNDVLTAVDAEAGRRLEGLVQAAAEADASRRRGGFLAAPGAPGQLPLTLSIMPFRAQGHPLFSEPAVFIIINDPARELALSPERLREAFGLTATETKVALGLFAGQPTGEVAEQLGISVNTVRNHLAHILEKTHSSGQAELSRRLMSLA